MRRQIGWLMASTTSAVVLAFVIPLCLLVRTLAEDRAVATADQEARNVAVLVFGLSDSPALDRLVAAADNRSDVARTTVVTADGRVVGARQPGIRATDAVRRAARGEAFTQIDSEGARVLIPVVTDAGTSVVETSVSTATLHQGVTRAWVSILSLGAVLLVIAILVGGRVGRRISTPVTELATVAQRLRDGDLDARAEPSGPPETQELGVALNRLAQRIIELLAAERAVVGDLSHRLRTPITALRLDVDSVRDPELTERLDEHIAQLQRTVDAIVKDAKRPVRSTMESHCEAGRVVGDRVSFWSALAEDQRRKLTVEIPPGDWYVAVDEIDLHDIVDILVDNVFAHTPEGVPFTIALRREHGRIHLTVRDFGPGLVDHSGGERVGSTGLGLQIVRRAVAGFGGETVVASMHDGGVQVDVTLPPLANRAAVS
jgi:signal transduction histidine kinase